MKRAVGGTTRGPAPPAPCSRKFRLQNHVLASRRTKAEVSDDTPRNVRRLATRVSVCTRRCRATAASGAHRSRCQCAHIRPPPLAPAPPRHAAAHRRNRQHARCGPRPRVAAAQMRTPPAATSSCDAPPSPRPSAAPPPPRAPRQRHRPPVSYAALGTRSNGSPWHQRIQPPLHPSARRPAPLARTPHPGGSARSHGGGLRGLEAVEPLLQVVVACGRPAAARRRARRLGRGAHDAVHRGAAHQRCAGGAHPRSGARLGKQGTPDDAAPGVCTAPAQSKCAAHAWAR